ncbi:MAG: futalosine hydrolase [Nitrospiraceae bacterium]|nr:MAG: futalosine hydrolase [Nitrospiraceae bacterium]
MSFESDMLLSLLKRGRVAAVAGKKAHRGKLAGLDVLLVNTGIGKVNAAHAVTAVVENVPADKIITIGVGGAYPGSGLGPGDVAVATMEISGDDGVITSEGWKDMQEIGIPTLQKGEKKYFNAFPLSALSKSFLKANIHRGIQIRSGPFITVGAATGTQKRAMELEKRFGGICENMEGAAIAQVCAIYGIPMAEIRGISNIAGIRDRRKWKLKEAAENCQQTVLRMLEFDQLLFISRCT